MSEFRQEITCQRNAQRGTGGLERGEVVVEGFRRTRCFDAELEAQPFGLGRQLRDARRALVQKRDHLHPAFTKELYRQRCLDRTIVQSSKNVGDLQQHRFTGAHLAVSRIDGNTQRGKKLCAVAYPAVGLTEILRQGFDPLLQGLQADIRELRCKAQGR